MKYNIFECALTKILTNLKYLRDILYMFEGGRRMRRVEGWVVVVVVYNI